MPMLFFLGGLLGLPLVLVGIICLNLAYRGVVANYFLGQAVPRDLSPRPRTPDPAEKVKLLEALKENGLISEEDYTRKRSEILGKS